MFVWRGNLTIQHKYKNCYFFRKSSGIMYLALAVAPATWYNRRKDPEKFMENIVFIIVMEGCAVLFLYLGFLLWKKQQIQQGYLLKQG